MSPQRAEEQATPANSVDEVVQRLGVLRLPDTNIPLLPEKLKDFKPDQALTNIKLHMTESNLARSEERPLGEIVHEHIERPAVDRVVFYSDTRPETMKLVAEGSTQQIFGCKNEAQSLMMQSNGYTRVEVSFPGGMSTLPPRLSAVASSSSAPAEKVMLTMDMPSINTRGEATAAEQIVRAYEVEVLDSSGARFSPFCHWSQEERKQSSAWEKATQKEREKAANHINRWGHVYCYIVASKESASSISMSMGELKKAAVAWAGGDPEEGGESASKKKKGPTWFEKAANLANERLANGAC